MKSPHHQIAFSIVTRHPNVLLDDEPLDDLIEDIASALQDAFDLGFKAAGGSIFPLNEDPSGHARRSLRHGDMDPLARQRSAHGGDNG